MQRLAINTALTRHRLSPSERDDNSAFDALIARRQRSFAPMLVHGLGVCHFLYFLGAINLVAHDPVLPMPPVPRAVSSSSSSIPAQV